MEWLFLWLICGIASAVIASNKGRSGLGWFLLGMLMGPFGLMVALLPSREDQAQREVRMTGQAGDYRKCPYCAEAIRVEAVKCRYCQSEIAPLTPRLPWIEDQHVTFDCPQCGITIYQRVARCMFCDAP